MAPSRRRGDFQADRDRSSRGFDRGASSYRPRYEDQPYRRPDAGDEPGRRRKKRPNPFDGGTSRPKKRTVAPLKTRIRDLRRLLDHATNMPADVRIAHERELAALQHELATTEAEIQKQEMIGRYHMVRFFDRQKATRHLKKAQRQLEQSTTDPEEQEKLRRQVYMAEVDLNYTIYFPLAQPYSSLYPKKRGSDDGKEHCDDEATAQGVRGDPAMWQLIEKAMHDDTLEALRNGLHTRQLELRSAPHSGAQQQKTARDSRSKPDIQSKAQQPLTKDADMDDESDGGFFEADGGVALP